MTTSSLSLQQRLPSVQSRLKILINNDLKNICRAYQVGISGTKATLQDRVMSLLTDAVRFQNYSQFEDIAARVSNHGEAPPKMNVTTQGPRPASHEVSRPGENGMRISFQRNPFYEKIQTIVRPTDLPAMPQNRHTVKNDIVLSEDQASRLANNPDQYRVMLYCAQTDSHNPPTLQIAFPPQIEVKLNDDDVKSNYKGLKNKPGSTKPADLSKLLRVRANYANKLVIQYALTHRRFVFTVLLVRYISPDSLVARIKAGSMFSKEEVLRDMRRINADPDIAATSSKMSLKDPISTLRITTPVRSTICTHSQCFDAAFYMQLQEQAPTWSCPICKKEIHFESLAVDKYVQEILESTTKSIEQVTIEPDGAWSVVKEDEEKGMSNAAKGAPRASYDDDFDDDLVEVDGPDSTMVKKEQVASNVFSTPPLSSRETSVQTNTAKRSAAVIDLTLSDDEEDEASRPAKRANTTSTAPRPSSWLPTPNSVSGRPSSNQLVQLDGLSYTSTYPAPAIPNNTTTSWRTPELPRPGSVSGSVGGAAQWGGLRSPSAQHAPQAGSSTAYRTSISKSPPMWPPQSQHQWPKDGDDSWLRLTPDRAGGVRLSDLPMLHRSGTFGALQERAQIDNSSDSYSGDHRPSS